MTPLVALSAFGTFMVFIALGLGALAFTAVLDRVLGKERALFVYALGLLALTAFVLRAEASPGATAAAQKEKDVTQSVAARTLEEKPLVRPGFTGNGGDERRNGFLRHSDTRPLPPISLTLPPEIALEFPLPPTIPGPAPAARRLLRGAVPALEDDASAAFEVPPVQFTEYVPRPEDVYDSYDRPNGDRVYIAIVSINGVRPHEQGFAALVGQLLSGENLDRLTVELAHIGTEKAAAKLLHPGIVAKVSKQNRQTDKASDATKFSAWRVRKTVANEYAEALRQTINNEPVDTTKNITGLTDAAKRMAAVGRTGKEGGAAWQRAAVLLERALKVAQETANPAVQTELLVQLVDAYRALNDEQAMLRALREYAAAAPNSGRPWLGLGELALHMLHLPEEALQYFAKAKALDPSSELVAVGEGDALTRLGRHAEALAAYGRAGNNLAAHVRRAEAALRLGDLARAQQSSDAAIQAQSDSPRALLVRGAVLYTKGTDLAAAKSAFAMAAASTADQGLWRAQALYNLGLTCWRLRETRAAIAAFDGCEKALRMGAAPSRFADETVSPSLGRALVAFTLKPKDPSAAPPPDPVAPPGAAPPVGSPLTVHRESLGEYLAAARDEARRVSYLDHFAGVLASGQGNLPGAIKALRRSLLLAPDATELDGWLALNHLRWAFSRQARTEAPTGAVSRDREERRLDAILAQSADEHFDAAVAFAARASKNDAVDPEAYLAMLRETWIRLQAENLSPRKRFEAAVAAADRVLSRSALREQPLALAMRGFAYYRLGGDENYDRSQRDFAQVLDKIQDKPEEKWFEWRTYAVKTSNQIKHWRSLEEKVVSFEGLSQFPKDWVKNETAGMQVSPENGVATFSGTAKKDGTVLEPLLVLLNQNLFGKDTFEELTLKIRIPTTKDGGAINNVTFGVAVQGPTSASGSGTGGVGPRHPGIGVFYDKAKVAARIGTGISKDWKEGDVRRVREEGEERAWPAGEWVTVRIVREDPAVGLMAIYLNNDEYPVVADKISGFKGAGGKGELWIGGWSMMSQQFDVQVKDIRIVRVKK